MPIYEYLCKDCNEKFEKYVRAWSDEVACPACRGGRVEKQVSSFAFASSQGFSGSVGGGCGCGRGTCGCHH